MGTGAAKTRIENGRTNGGQFGHLALSHVHQLVGLVEKRPVMEFLGDERQHAQHPLVRAKTLFNRGFVEAEKVV